MVSRLRRRVQELDALVALTRELQETGSNEEVDAVLAAHLTDRLGFGRVAVLRHGENGTTGVVRAGGVNVQVMWAPAEPTPVPWRQTPWRRQLSSLQPLTDPLLDRLLPCATNVAVAPVYRLPQEAAVVVAERAVRRGRRSGSAFDALDRAVEVAAQRFAQLGELEETKWRATRDGLTGLVNRRLLDDALEWAVASATRTGAPVSLLMLDLDHFKVVNDTHGHQVGDEVLRNVGRLIAGASRAADITARYGGDEFAVILPGCDGDAAVTLAERLRAVVAANGAPVRTTLSAGVATVPDDAASAEGLVAAADAALYASKRSGRDRTTLATTARQGRAPVIRLERPPAEAQVIAVETSTGG